jgi:hypothetical protein
VIATAIHLTERYAGPHFCDLRHICLGGNCAIFASSSGTAPQDVRAAGGHIMKSSAQPHHEASIYIEQDGAKFKIQSNQLERIGEQLRGPRRFSIFQSIILPVIVTVATLVFTSLFQYVSWYNSVNVQNATDVAANAERAYEKAAEAAGRRQYATFVFLPSLRELVAEAGNSMPAGETDASAKNQKDPKNLALAAFALAPIESPLHKSILENRQRRFEAYYKELRLWNENYDHLLTDIEYSLDRPVFKQGRKEIQKTSYAKFSQIDCSKSLAAELERLQLDSQSLKLWFAGLHKCFRDTSGALYQLQSEAARPALAVYNESLESQVTKNLQELLSKSNAFRCRALRRIDHYKAQKELSILSVSYVWRRLNDAAQIEAQKHFEDTAKACTE